MIKQSPVVPLTDLLSGCTAPLVMVSYVFCAPENLRHLYLIDNLFNCDEEFHFVPNVTDIQKSLASFWIVFHFNITSANRSVHYYDVLS